MNFFQKNFGKLSIFPKNLMNFQKKFGKLNEFFGKSFGLFFYIYIPKNFRNLRSFASPIHEKFFLEKPTIILKEIVRCKK